MIEKRRYELKKRGEQQDATRRRIVEAAVELHRTVGPAATQISEIARRAGVQRVTVYNHFADDAALLAACSAHWRSLHPTPDPAAWLAIGPPFERVRHGLAELYAWYRETEPMTVNVLRDAERLPPLRSIIDVGLGAWLERVRRILAAAFSVADNQRERLEAAVRVVVDVHVWRALAALGDAAAAQLAAELVELAAGARPAHGGTRGAAVATS